MLPANSYAQRKDFIIPKEDTLLIPKYDRKSDVIFFSEKRITPEQIIANFDKTKLGKLIRASVIYYCQSCDSTIFRVRGIDADALADAVGGSQGTEKTEDPNGSKNKPVATGDSTIKKITGRFERVSYTVNYRLSVPDDNNGVAPDLSKLTPFFDIESDAYRNVYRTGKTRVAIFDSGMDSILAKYYRIDNLKSCVNQREIGWNFTANSSNYSDNYKVKGKKQYHGWPVASLVIQEANRSSDLAILPVKVLDASGTGDLYSIMCGLAYAKSAGAKIINMSFGMYASPRSAVREFENYIRTITNAGIIIVAAAGNAIDGEEKNLRGMAAHEPRNLDYHPFYPAAFSDSNQNIISVTTATPNPLVPRTINFLSIVDRQNYSKKRVQIAVMADSTNNSFFLPGHKDSRIGSSFAVPIVTGKIAAIYNDFIKKYPPPERNRENLLSLMENNGIIKMYPSLQSKIQNGFLLVRKK